MPEATLGREGRLRRFRDQHFDCFLELASAARTDGGGKDWRRILDDESGNLRSALEWGIESGRPDAAELAISLQWYWTASRRFREGRDLLERALRIPDLRADHRIDALVSAGLLAWNQGDLAAAREHSEAARQLAAAHADAPRRAQVCVQLGYTLLTLQRLGEAAEVFGEALDLADHLDLSDRASALRGMSWARTVDGDYATGVRLHREARALLEDANHPDLPVHCSTEVNFLVKAGEAKEALALAARVVDMARAGGPGRNLIAGLEAHANAARLVGDADLRRRILEEALRVSRAAGHAKEAFFRLQMADHEVAQGETDAAAAGVALGLELLAQLEPLSVVDLRVRIRLLAIQARLAADEGNRTLAEKLYREIADPIVAPGLQAEVLADFARMLSEHGDRGGAVAAQNRSVGLVDPSDALGALERSADLALFQDDLVEALRLRTEARDLVCRHSPASRPGVYRRKVEVVAELGRVAEALEEIDAVLVTESLVTEAVERARLHLDRARLRLILERPEGARHDLMASEPIARSGWAADQIHVATTAARLALAEGRRDAAIGLWSAVQHYRRANQRVTPRLSRAFESPLEELPATIVSPPLDSRAALAALRGLVAEELRPRR